MIQFISKEKLGKKARKELDERQRATWQYAPVTKKIESKKRYISKEKIPCAL